MNEQKQLWNRLHNQRNIGDSSGAPTDFAEEVMQVIDPCSKVLELGCGSGNDSLGFAKAGHKVLATDFSEVAINRNSEYFRHIPDLSFDVLDIGQPMSFDANEFDLVYARLSLHYFTDEVTGRIMSEVHRVLKPYGYLCFVCKSTSDPLYGKGTEIEKDMFEFDGHIRHFFSEEYARSLLQNNFEIETIEGGIWKFNRSHSAFVKVVARAIK
jgi:SAM-dependent methyltransferase